MGCSKMARDCTYRGMFAAERPAGLYEKTLSRGVSDGAADERTDLDLVGRGLHLLL